MLLEDPVILEVVLKRSLGHQVAEDFTHVLVIRFLLELDIAAVVQVLIDLVREASCKLFQSGANFFLLDSVILGFLVAGLKALPRQLSFQEIYQDKAQAF